MKRADCVHCVALFAGNAQVVGIVQMGSLCGVDNLDCVICGGCTYYVCGVDPFEHEKGQDCADDAHWVA